MNKETSIFHEYGKFTEVKITENKYYSQEKTQDGLSKFRETIMHVLYRYRLLNKQSLLKCLQIRKKSTWKRNMLSKTLKSLRSEGYISLYKMEGRPIDEQNLNFYMLTETGIKSLNKEGNYMFVDINNTRACLDILSLNQWHINQLYILEGKVIKSFYEKFVTKESTIVPSFVQYKRQINSIINLFTYTAPHEEKDLEHFMLKLIHNYEFLLENPQYRPALIILLCENLNHASWISWKLNKVKEMRPLNSFIYALDIMTNKEQMLSMLYSCNADEEGMTRINISLK